MPLGSRSVELTLGLGLLCSCMSGLAQSTGAAPGPAPAAAERPCLPVAAKPIDVALPPQDTNAAKSAILGLKDKLPNADIATDALAVINEILAQTRNDQALMYAFARTAGSNLAYAENQQFAADARLALRELLKATYSDSLFQNKNLSKQMATRLQFLLADTVRIVACRAPAGETEAARSAREAVRKLMEDDFVAELQLMRTRFLESRRFRLGVGAEYVYLPQMSYATAPVIDLSPYQAFGNFAPRFSNQPIGLVSFNNGSTAALVLSANLPGARVDFVLPAESQTQSLNTGVRKVAASDSNTSRDLLFQTVIEAKAKAEYDAAISITARCAGRLLRLDPCSDDMEESVTWDAAVGIGTTGFKVEETATTDVRVRDDPTKSFNELASTGRQTTRKTFAFNAEYLLLSVRSRISDEFVVSLSTRRYRKATVDTGPVNLRGTVIAISAVWYPTFGW